MQNSAVFICFYCLTVLVRPYGSLALGSHPQISNAMRGRFHRNAVARKQRLVSDTSEPEAWDDAADQTPIPPQSGDRGRYWPWQGWAPHEPQLSCPC